LLGSYCRGKDNHQAVEQQQGSDGTKTLGEDGGGVKIGPTSEESESNYKLVDRIGRGTCQSPTQPYPRSKGWAKKNYLNTLPRRKIQNLAKRKGSNIPRNRKIEL